jgi:hypothetical protein
MSSDLISYLLEDKVAEFEQEKAVLVEERTALETTMRQRLQQAVEDILAVRFPAIPLAVALQVRQINDPDQLQHLIQAVAAAPDIATVEQAIAAARPPAP